MLTILHFYSSYADTLYNISNDFIAKAVDSMNLPLRRLAVGSDTVSGISPLEFYLGEVVTFTLIGSDFRQNNFETGLILDSLSCDSLGSLFSLATIVDFSIASERIESRAYSETFSVKLPSIYDLITYSVALSSVGKAKLCYRFSSSTSTWSYMQSGSDALNFIHPVSLNSNLSTFPLFQDTPFNFIVTGMQERDEILFAPLSSGSTDAACTDALSSGATVYALASQSTYNSDSLLTASTSVSRVSDALRFDKNIEYGLCYNSRSLPSTSSYSASTVVSLNDDVWRISILTIQFPDEDLITASINPVTYTSSSTMNVDFDTSLIMSGIGGIRYFLWPILAGSTLDPNICRRLANSITSTNLGWSDGGSDSITFDATRAEGGIELVGCAMPQWQDPSNTLYTGTLLRNSRTAAIEGFVGITPTLFKTATSSTPNIASYSLNVHFSRNTPSTTTFSFTINSVSSVTSYPSIPGLSSSDTLCSSTTSVASFSASPSSSIVSISTLNEGIYVVCAEGAQALQSLQVVAVGDDPLAQTAGSNPSFSLESPINPNMRNSEVDNDLPSVLLTTSSETPITSTNTDISISVNDRFEWARNDRVADASTGWIMVMAPGLHSGVIFIPFSPGSRVPFTLFLSDVENTYDSIASSSVDAWGNFNFDSMPSSTSPTADMNSFYSTINGAFFGTGSGTFSGVANEISGGSPYSHAFILDGHRIRSFSSNSLDIIPAGRWIDILYAGLSGAGAPAATFGTAQTIATDSTGLSSPVSIVAHAQWIYIADAGNNRIVTLERNTLNFVGSISITNPISVSVSGSFLFIGSHTGGLYRAEIHCSTCTKHMTARQSPQAARWTVQSGCTSSASTLGDESDGTVDQCRLRCLMTNGCGGVIATPEDADGAEEYGRFSCVLLDGGSDTHTCVASGTTGIILHSLLRSGAADPLSLTSLISDPVAAAAARDANTLLVLSKNAPQVRLFSVDSLTGDITTIATLSDDVIDSVTINSATRSSIVFIGHSALFCISTQTFSNVRSYRFDKTETHSLSFHLTTSLSSLLFPQSSTSVDEDKDGIWAFASIRASSNQGGRSGVVVPVPRGVLITPEEIAYGGISRDGIGIKGPLGLVSAYLRSIQVSTSDFGITRVDVSAGISRLKNTQTSEVLGFAGQLSIEILSGGVQEVDRCNCEAFKGFCSAILGGQCQCSPPYLGISCEKKSCGSKTCLNGGYCDFASGKCQCVTGFSGANCERFECVDNCNGRGHCIQEEKRCVCTSGWEGESCQTRSITTNIQ